MPRSPKSPGDTIASADWNSICTDVDAVLAAGGGRSFTSTLSGVVPLSGGGTVNFLRADGTWAAPPGGGGGGSWGSITGTLSSQSDLNTALNGKQPLDATLTAVAALAWSAGTQVPALTAADTFTLKTVGSAAGNLLDKTAGDALYQPVGSYLTGNQTITLSGDASGSGATAITVTVTKINGVALSGLATGILKNTTGTGVPSIAVAADFPTLNQNTTGSAATLTTSRNFSISGGGITASAVGFNGSANVTLSASVDAAHITLARMANLAANSVIGNNTGSAATPIALTQTQLTAMVNAFSSSLSGAAPASGGGTTNFLRADGTWAAPAGGGGTTTNAVTFNNSGAGAASGTTFDGSVARTISYNTFGLGTAALKNLSVGTAAPGSPSVNDLWVDTN